MKLIKAIGSIKKNEWIIIAIISIVLFIIVKKEIKNYKKRKTEELQEELLQDYYEHLDKQFNAQEFADLIYNELTKGWTKIFGKWFCNSIMYGTNCVDDDRLVEIIAQIPSKRHFSEISRIYTQKYKDSIKGSIIEDIIYLAGSEFYYRKIKPILDTKR